MRYLAAAGIVVIACFLSCSQKDEPAGSKLNWQPALDQPIRQLEEVLAAVEKQPAGQQHPINYTAANLGFLYDAKLYVFFERYLATLSSDGCRTASREQQQWLLIRAKQTDEAYAEYEGGSFASLNASYKFIELTKTRIAEIEARIKPPASSRVQTH